jgi:hypothetical protein
MPESRRRELAELASATGTLIVEDLTTAEPAAGIVAEDSAAEQLEGPIGESADVHSEPYSDVVQPETIEDRERHPEFAGGADGLVDPDTAVIGEPTSEGTALSLAPSAAQARLGTEGIVRLRGRYSEILARIDERITDPVKREHLKTQAERLNPDAWVTDQEVQAGLEQYEAVFESLRAVVGRRRRRRRRRGSRPQTAAPSERATHTENPEAGESDTGGDDDL